MLLAGAPCDLCKQLPACSSLQSVGSVALLLACQFLCSVFSQPSLPPSLIQGQARKKTYWLVSIPLTSLLLRCLVGLLAGLPWITPPSLCWSIASSTNFVGNSAQAHLVVISLTTTYIHCICTVEPFFSVVIMSKLSVKKITNIFLGYQQNCWATIPWILGMYIYSQSFALG